MVQLELRTTVRNAHCFRLFKQGGEEMPLPDESGWEFVYPEMNHFESPGYFPDPDKKLMLNLEPGKYWLIKANNNITQVFSLEAGDAALQRSEIGCVANGFLEQAGEVGKVAVTVPRPVLDVFMELGALTT